MDFFGIGIQEFILIAVIALLVLGPERLPEAAAQAGRLVRELRRYATNVTSQFSGDLEEIRRELELTRQELARTREQVERETTPVTSRLSETADILSGRAEGQAPAAPADGQAEPAPKGDGAGR
ncbi:MAG TPA: Sec-independent protein translocase protein TatB [Dehalococcoidia bacterium]